MVIPQRKKILFKSKKSMYITLIWGYLLSGGFLCIGLLWLQDYMIQGYYYMSKEEVYISGKEAIVSLAGIIIFSLLMLIYTIYLTIRGIIQIRHGELMNIEKDSKNAG